MQYRDAIQALGLFETEAAQSFSRSMIRFKVDDQTSRRRSLAERNHVLNRI
jgi:hypothetical protein